MNEIVSGVGRHSTEGASSRRVAIYDGERKIKRAWEDLAEGFKAWHLWGTLAWSDIRERYARSMLGPFWLTVTMAVLVVSLAILYGGLFGRSVPEFLPYLGTGFIVWSFISTCIIEGCHTFTMAAGTIKQVSAPLSVYGYRVLWRNLIVFLHIAVIYLLILIFFPVSPSFSDILLGIVGFGLLCVNFFWAALVLGIVCARFRDVPPLVASLVQVAFFITPVFWHADQLPRRYAIVDYNPFKYFIEIVRQPLLGEVPDLSNWIIVVALTLLVSLVSFVFFARYRWRIAYWI